MKNFFSAQGVRIHPFEKSLFLPESEASWSEREIVESVENRLLTFPTKDDEKKSCVMCEKGRKSDDWKATWRVKQVKISS